MRFSRTNDSSSSSREEDTELKTVRGTLPTTYRGGAYYGSLVADIEDPPEPQSRPYGSPLDAINQTEQRTRANKLAWGAAFGAGFAFSQLVLYWLFAFTTPDRLGVALDKSNLIPLSSNIASQTILNYSIYLAGAAFLSAIVNERIIKWQERKAPSDIDGERYAEMKKTDDINKLFFLTVKQKRLEQSWTSLGAGALAFSIFAYFNINYCITFKDVGNDAIDLLPNFLGLYGGLNQYAGWISFLMNTVLNQWFSFGIINLVTTSYKRIKMTRAHYHKDNDASYTNVAKNIGKTQILSIVSSLSFFFLAQDDPHLDSVYLKLTVPLSAFIVYGAVLNTEGSISLIKDISRFWSWLNTCPQPFINAHNLFKQYTGYIFGYLAYQVKEFTKEVLYHIRLYKGYLSNNDLNLPDPEASERAPLSLTNHFGRRNNRSTGGIRPAYTNGDLKTEVDRLIIQLEDIKDDSAQQLLDLIHQAKENLTKARTEHSTRADVWKYGRVRKLLAETLPWFGPFGLTVVLAGYYFLINHQLTDTSYQHVGLSEGDAWARLLTFYLFYPFVKLVHDSGYSAINKMLFAGLGHKITEIYHTCQVLSGTKKSTDFDYTNRFHPTTKKEAGLFGLGFIIFGLQAAAFIITPPSAGTVCELLYERGLLSPFTKTFAFWFTALFNSFGVASFLSWGKDKIIKEGVYRDRKDLFRGNTDFFKAVEEPRGCHFDLDQLNETVYTPAAAAA